MPTNPAPEEAIREDRLLADVRHAIQNTPLLVPGTLFDLLCTTTYANDHVIGLLLHDAAVNAVAAIAAWNRRAGSEREAWQPIETAPKDGTWILGWADSDSCPYRVSWGRNHRDALTWCTAFNSFNAGYITHWQPLPDPPSAALGDGNGG